MPTDTPATSDDLSQVPAICRTPALPVTATEKRIVLLIAILAGFLTPFDGSAVNIALPTIGTAFHMDAIALSWVATAYLLASALFLVPFGKIADIYGRKKIFLWGICIFGAASFVMTLVATEQQMIGVRVIQGIGAAMIFGTAIAILTAVFPPGERGKALGIYITSVYLGLSLGPFFGGVLTDLFGWRSIFYINVPIAITAAILIIWKLRGEWAECIGEKFDLSGSLLYSIALVSLMVGFSVLPDVTGGVLVVAGVVLIGVFVWFEQRLAFPVLNMQLFFKSRIFAFSNIAALINYSATYAVAFLLSLDLQYTKGFSAEYAGFILIAAPFFQMIVSPFAGRLSDKHDSQVLSSLGMGLTALGLFLFIFLNESTPLWYIIVVLVILGIGFGLFSSPNINAIMGAVDKRYYGVASGINSTMRLLGQMLSMGISMMIFAIVIGQVEITPANYPQFTQSLHWAFVLFTVMCLVGIFFSLARGKRGGQKIIEG
jgi:EmrB/QacA subfamily drug resistance transporter